VLLIAGAAFASKKIYDRRKKSVQNEMWYFFVEKY
jgi:hypothetical protein